MSKSWRAFVFQILVSFGTSELVRRLKSECWPPVVSEDRLPQISALPSSSNHTVANCMYRDLMWVRHVLLVIVSIGYRRFWILVSKIKERAPWASTQLPCMGEAWQSPASPFLRFLVARWGLEQENKGGKSERMECKFTNSSQPKAKVKWDVELIRMSHIGQILQNLQMAWARLAAIECPVARWAGVFFSLFRATGGEQGSSPQPPRL